MFASWFLVSMYLIWTFGIQINSIEQPIRCNSVGSGNMPHCWTPAFHNHFDHSLIVLKHIQQSFMMRGLDVEGNTININQHVDLPLRSLTSVNDNRSPNSLCRLEAYDVCEHHSQVSPNYLKHEKHFQEQKRLDRIIPEQATHPISIQRPKR